MFTNKFSELSALDTDIAGGKGSSLAEMTAAGISVPPGFVILSTTFDVFLQESNLHAHIASILHSVNIEVVSSIDSASEQIQALISESVIPTVIREEIVSQFQALEVPFVAVRSSATAEDGADHAWAGQLDSYLNTTEETLLKHVQRCWASLFTPRAIFYRFEKGLHDEYISVAVVVQAMVNSEASGVAFSVHPVTEDRNQIIIEAGFGLGEAIVSGQITPDSYVIEKDPRRIIDISTNTQIKALYRAESGGNVWQDIAEPKASLQVLSEVQIGELSDIIMLIEQHYGFPCDIEWAFEDGTFYIVQSRPITTLGNIHHDKLSENEIMELYQQTGEPIGAYQISLPILACTKPMMKYFPCSYGDLWVYTKQNRITNLIQLSHMKEVSYYFFSVAKNGIPIEWKNEWGSVVMEMHQLAREIRILNLETLSNQELWEYYSRMFDLDQRMWAISIFIDALDAGFDQEEISRIQHEYSITDEEKNILLSPCVPAYITKFENLLVDMKEGTVPAQEIMDEYYWIGTDYGNFFEVDKHWLNTRAEKAERHSFISPKATQEQILKEKNYTVNPLQVFQDLGQWRDDRKILNFVGLYGCVRILREGLRRQNIHTECVNFLSPDDVQNVFFGMLSEEQLRMRNEHGMLYLIHEDGTLTYQEGEAARIEFDRLSQFLPSTDTHSFSGMVACPGKVRGRVCYADTPESENAKKMQKGDILVTSMTRPEFVPLMRLAGAIVTDEGGISSHAAIVSREMNIPCVIGTKIATKVLKDGDMVEVDATSGVVRLL
jgi:phosphohistidine swiveling domain-containing protein